MKPINRFPAARLRAIFQWSILAAMGYWPCPSVVGSPILALDRELPATEARNVWPMYEDYNGDGVDDLLVRVPVGDALGTRARIISGLTGATLREYTAPSVANQNDAFSRGITLPDSDGDGKREILLRDPTAVWAIKSTAGGGRVDLLPHVFAFSGLPHGQAVRGSDSSVVIASGDESKLLFVDPRTGEIQARLSHSVPFGHATGSLGESAINLGDLTGDGIDDFASTGGNVAHTPAPSGSLFILNGAVRTTGPSYVPLPALPPGSVLSELSGAQYMGSGSAGGWENTALNLGDPNPNDGLTQFLIATGSPLADGQAGALAAHVLTRAADGSFQQQLVASYSPHARLGYGSELVDLGDVNGDGVHDFAQFAAEVTDSQNRLLGRVEVIDGAGLLDGFDPVADVLQTIDGQANDFFYGSFQNLGDYDHDGIREIAITVYDANHYRQRIYQIVPEPSAVLIGGLFLAMHCLSRRRSRKMSRDIDIPHHLCYNSR